MYYLYVCKQHMHTHTNVYHSTCVFSLFFFRDTPKLDTFFIFLEKNWEWKAFFSAL